MSDNLDNIFARLKNILKRYELVLRIEQDTEDGYSLNAPVLGPNNKPLFFGAAQIKKNYVSFYLMPVYMYPDLLDGISEQLKRRMQGKSCFNFKTLDESLMEELSTLTQRSFERLQQEEMG